MKKRALVLALLALSGAAGFVAAADRDARADAVGKELIAAMGGMPAWEKARQFRFDFVVVKEGKPVARFTHVWDRYTGDYRLSGTDKSRRRLRRPLQRQHESREGLRRRPPREADKQAPMLEDAYGRFINDTYWLLAPWKIFDPGVHLAYDGEKPCPGGGTCDVLSSPSKRSG